MVQILAECWTPSEVAEPRAHTPFPLLSTSFSGALEEGREGKEALQHGFEMLVLVALEKGVRAVCGGATQGKERKGGREAGREVGHALPLCQSMGGVFRALEAWDTGVWVYLLP